MNFRQTNSMWEQILTDIMWEPQIDIHKGHPPQLAIEVSMNIHATPKVPGDANSPKSMEVRSSGHEDNEKSDDEHTPNLDGHAL